MPQWYDELLRRDLPSFIGKCFSTIDPATAYMPNWHIDIIAEYLQAAERGQIKRLIINMPPRALKSVCVSVAWPAWLMGHDPRRRILAASYSAALSLKHSLDCRGVMQAPWYRCLFPATELSHEQNEKHKFMTTSRGFRFATSVGGSLTGEGGNYLLIDDPLSPMQAANSTMREHVNRWFEHTFASRLNDKQNGVMVLVMQRLHQNDLSGYLLEKGGWEHLCLPAIAPEAKVFDFGRVRKTVEQGELLHRSREGEAALSRAKKELGGQAFAAQYLQTPLPQEGAMLRPWWLKRFTLPPATVVRRVQSWDTAIKSGAQHDASVCLTFEEHEGISYLRDACVLRLEYPDLKRQVLAHAAQWKPDVILIEDKASGQQLLQDLRRDAQLPLVATQPKTDKVTRFAAISAMIEAGRLALPEQAAWLADFESELLLFPHASHDDQVDALTQYLDWLRKGAWEKLRVRSL